MSYININGQILEASQPVIAHDSRAFRYGYGIFETMLVQDGHIQLGAYHWERLFAGAAALYFEMPKLWTAAYLGSEVLKTVKKNKLEGLCRVRLQLYAKSGGLYDGKDQKPEFLIECFPIDEQIIQHNDNGLVLGVANGLQKATDSLANLKSCNALIYAMAAQQAKAARWNDALVLNTTDHIIESTIANIFWVKDQKLFTPPLTEGCVAGVMRRHLLIVLPENGYPVTESILTEEILYDADEVLLTNAIRGIKWVKAIADKHYSNSFIQSIYHSAGF